MSINWNELEKLKTDRDKLVTVNGHKLYISAICAALQDMTFDHDSYPAIEHIFSDEYQASIGTSDLKNRVIDYAESLGLIEE